MTCPRSRAVSNGSGCDSLPLLTQPTVEPLSPTQVAGGSKTFAPILPQGMGGMGIGQMVGAGTLPGEDPLPVSSGSISLVQLSTMPFTSYRTLGRLL